MISLGEPISPNGQELLAEFMQYGRQRPFEEITRRYAGMVFNVCLRITKDKHDAEDATQAVFLTLALQAKRGVEIKALGPWLQQVAKRLSLDMRRSKKRRKAREQRHHTEQSLRRNGQSNGHSLPPADLEEIKTILHEELHKLPSKYRMPLILHYFGGMTRDEMAVELGCKASTLGVRIFRGREMLAGRLNGRGVSLSLSTFSAMMAYTIQSTVNHAMVAHTSHAAMAVMGGHESVVSAQVIGLTRRAAGAVALGKVKVAAVILILAGASLGAGAEALGMLQAIDIGRIIRNQIQHLIRPMTEPLQVPLRADATPKPARAILAVQRVEMASPIQSNAAPYVAVENPGSASNDGFVLPAMSVSSAGPLKMMAATPAPWLLPPNNWGASAGVQSANSYELPTPASGSVVAQDTEDTTGLPSAGDHGASSDATTSDQAGIARKNRVVTGAKPAAPVGPAMTASAADNLSIAPTSAGAASPSSPQSAMYALALNQQSATAGSGTADAAAPAMGAPASSNSIATAAPPSSSTSNSAASNNAATRIIRIPAGNGNVTLSNGVLSGWGTINRTGTLDVSGQVIADGGGVNRTLDLSSFQTVCTSIENSSTDGTNGWYASNHGRLVLPLKAATTGSAVTWGGDPNEPVLNLVNSVRFLPDDSDDVPAQVSLLAIDRQDVPSLSGLGGLPIGLWQVDTADGGLASSMLWVRYDDVLVDSLGVSESAVQLWTYGNGNWQTVAPATFALDTADHVVSGYGSDFDYFAVAVPWSGNVPQMIAMAGNERAFLAVESPASGDASPASVPEPGGLVLLALGGSLLLRRRRC